MLLGLLVPPAAAIATALYAFDERSRTTSNALSTAASTVALACLVPPFVILALAGLVRRWCEPEIGLAFFALGPGIGTWLAAYVGAAAGAAAPTRRRAVLLAIAAPLGSLLYGLFRFYDTPAIYAYAHFVGYVPGTLYDPDIAIESPYLTLRAISLTGVFFFSRLLTVRDEHGRISLRMLRDEPLTLALLVVITLGASLAEWNGTALGHRSTTASIVAALGREVPGEHCIAVVPAELPREQAERLRDDCDFRVAEAARRLGVTQRAPIRAFFFRGVGEKRRLMGASGTYIAKPWRNEVYLQLAGWPHPVLFHEIVHVVAANVGRGPFRISGRLGGLIPSAGIIEGVAVAISWEERDGLTPHQWAHAMSELGQTPRIATTEGLRFLLEPASRAYTANGSFVRYLLDTRGAAIVRRLYLTGSYEEALGEPLGPVEDAWRAYLETVPVPDDALERARLRFERPAIFSQVCPHAVAALGDELAEALASGNEEEALAHCDAILEIDEGDARVMAQRVAILASRGRVDEAEEALSALLHAEPGTPITLLARDALAEAYWRRGQLDRARSLLETNASLPQTEDSARQIEVKLLALDAGGATGEALRDLLAPSRAHLTDGATMFEAIARLAAARDDGLADYLAARQLIARERFDLAAAHVERALELGLPTTRLLREALRVQATALGALDDPRAMGLWTAIRDGAGDDLALAVRAEDWRRRLTTRAHRTAR